MGGFTREEARTIHAPVIGEAFLSVECTLRETMDLSGAGIGQVQHLSVEETHARGPQNRSGENGFMMLVPGVQNLVTGEPNPSGIATVNVERWD